MQWCHGALGIVTVRVAFPRARSARAEAMLPGAGQAIGQPGPLTKGPGLFHGTAGHTLALLTLRRRTGDELWLHRTRAFAMNGCEQNERLRREHGQARGTLGTGDAGLALYLWRCLEGSGAFQAAARESQAYLVKPAFTDKLLLIVTVQVGWVPTQAPLQPVKARPGSAVAVSVTAVLASKLAAQAAAQLMPAGALVTVPTLLKLSDRVSGPAPPPPPPPPPPTAVTKVADTEPSAFSATVQLPALPAHRPRQVAKVLPELALAVSVTVAPGAYTP